MIELNKIYNEDLQKTISKIPNDYLNLVVTSPPYNCGIDYDIHNDNMPWEEYLKWSKSWVGDLYPVMKPDGRLCINVLVEMGNYEKRVSPQYEFCKILQEVGFKIAALPMWTDTHRIKYTAWGSWLNASAPYIYNPYEVIIIAYKDVWKKQNKGKSTISKEDFMKGCSGVWNILPETKQLTKANFPEKLASLCINLLSYEGDIVYDPFMGSGTTAKCCKLLRRKYIGSEISPAYCEIAEQRLYDICFIGGETNEN